MKKTMRAIVLVMACLLMLTAFVSCGKSADSVKSAAEKKGYKCENATAEEIKAISEVMGVPVTERLIIRDEANGTQVSVFFFESKRDAKDARVNIEDSVKQLAGYEASGIIVERKGKAVVTGNADMIDNIW